MWKSKNVYQRSSHLVHSTQSEGKNGLPDHGIKCCMAWIDFLSNFDQCLSNGTLSLFFSFSLERMILGTHDRVH